MQGLCKVENVVEGRSQQLQSKEGAFENAPQDRPIVGAREGRRAFVGESKV